MMDIFFVQLFSLIEVIFRPVFVQSAFIALNNSHNVMHLYHNLWNTDAPSARDPATSDDPEIRKNICKDITYDGLEFLLGMDAVDMTNAYEELRTELYYSDILIQIYIYANKYKEIFYHAPESEDFTEYVFVCLMRSLGRIIPFYVSKEYDVAPVGQPFKPGRFVFPDQFLAVSPPTNFMILAEEPAIPFSEPEFDVELYFLQIRNHIPIAESNEIDPLCRLISDDNDDPDNQHYRICVAVSRSSAFADIVLYPAEKSSKCEAMEVSFITEQNGEKLYYERMTPCYPDLVGSDGDESLQLYISRGYGSNQVLVYEMNPVDGKIHLLNLSTNISIADELNSFDLVEE